MKDYVKAVLCEGEEMAARESVSKEDIDNFERHIAYCCHERLVHLLVTLAFAVMTIICMGIMLRFAQIGTALLFLLFAVMTAAYVWHYYFLENSVQKMYKTADEIHKKQYK